MNLNDLTKIDLQSLQNITGDDIKDFFKSHLTISINIALVGMTILFVIVMFGSQAQSSARLRETMIDLQEKLKTVTKSEAADAEYDEFFIQIPPPLKTDELRKKLSDLSLENDIQILSFLPKEKTEDEYAQIANFEMNILSRNYRNIVAFTGSIEKLKYAVRIDKWTGKMEESQFNGEDIELMESPITATLNLSVVFVKDNREGKDK